ncbi:MAG: hypothetical protein WKF34_05140 [Pyrinomonadaceae bacterium]
MSDRTPLVPVIEAPEQATVVITSPPGASSRPVVAGVNPIFAYLSIALLALVAGGAGVYWMTSESGNSQSSKNDGAVTKSPISEPNAAGSPAPSSPQKTNSQTPQARVANQQQKPPAESKPLNDQDDGSEAPTPEHAGPQDYPTARIKFRRGRVAETVSSTISSERGYVLYTLGGQQLSARIRSEGDCVVFMDGSTSTSYTTSNGDSYLRLKNNCRDAARFGLTVQVR